MRRRAIRALLPMDSGDRAVFFDLLR